MTITNNSGALTTRVDIAIRGIRVAAPVHREGGAGPSDDGHVLFQGMQSAIPVNQDSPYLVDDGKLLLDGEDTGLEVSPVSRPAFYDLVTADGVSYEQIARLHGAKVLATTVVQTCIRYKESERCRFCSIEEAVPDLMIQVQCEPPADLQTITDLYDAGARSIGIHVESMDEDVRKRWMPGKSRVTLDEYRAAWREAVRVFGRNQVSTYLLVGMGEDPDEMVAGAQELIDMGVYPFVVPFRPIRGTLATDVDKVPAPHRAVLHDITFRVSQALIAAGMRGSDQKAGCAACGACSALQTAGG